MTNIITEINNSKFAPSSRAKLLGIDPQLALVAVRARELANFEIISGKRTLEEQKRLLRLGKTKTLNSKHLDGKAFDFAPVAEGVLLFDTAEVIGQLQTKFGIPSPSMVTSWIYATYAYTAGIILAVGEMMGVKLRSGIDWDMDKIILFDQKFQDFGHIELA